MLNPFRRIVDFYWRFLVSPIDYARHIGVFVGENSFIATRKWSSEPYLITIGNNVQITSGVAIHTHGGNPARYICTVDEYIQKNLEFNLQIHGKNLSLKEKRKFLLTLPEEKFLKK